MNDCIVVRHERMNDYIVVSQKNIYDCVVVNHKKTPLITVLLEVRRT
jgi:hypothetical protein